jgi:hypothetical protein
MGLFEFLKGKPKPAARQREPESMQEALDELGDKLGGQPRYWHHLLHISRFAILHCAARDCRRPRPSRGARKGSSR